MSRTDQEWDDILTRALKIRSNIRAISDALEEWPLRFDDVGLDLMGKGPRDGLALKVDGMERLANQLIGNCYRTPDPQ